MDNNAYHMMHAVPIHAHVMHDVPVLVPVHSRARATTVTTVMVKTAQLSMHACPIRVVTAHANAPDRLHSSVTAVPVMLTHPVIAPVVWPSIHVIAIRVVTTVFVNPPVRACISVYVTPAIKAALNVCPLIHVRVRRVINMLHVVLPARVLIPVPVNRDIKEMAYRVKELKRVYRIRVEREPIVKTLLPVNSTVNVNRDINDWWPVPTNVYRLMHVRTNRVIPMLSARPPVPPNIDVNANATIRVMVSAVAKSIHAYHRRVQRMLSAQRLVSDRIHVNA